MPRPPVDARLQKIEKGIVDISKKLDQIPNRASDCGCTTSISKDDEKENGESQNDK